jgi:hypothetical protein
MWITISNENSLENSPCERCGSKRRVSKTWTEEHLTLTGTTTIECSQVICTNPECQEVFDKKLLADTQKREEIKKVKDERDALRKMNAQKNRNVKQQLIKTL